MDRKWADSLREKLHWKKKNKTENAQESGDGRAELPQRFLPDLLLRSGR